MPASHRLRLTSAMSASMLTPSAARMSAEPQREERLRLPCLATGTPAPATTSAVAVETLKVPEPSPPVPHVSIAPSGASIGNALARIVRAAPVISSTVSPRTLSAIRKPPICAGVALPDIIASKAVAASSSLSRSPAATRPISVLRSSMSEVIGGGSCRDARRRRQAQEIAEQLMTADRGDALGMELDAVERPLAVLQPHDDAVGRLGGDGQAVRPAGAVDDEGVIAR